MQTVEMIQYEISYGVKEEINQLRNNVLFFGEDKKVLLFTSCVSGEGKSTTARLLAKSLTELKKNVLLIDCDLRKSVLRRQFIEGTTIKYGLSHILSGQCTVEEAVCRDKATGLDIIPSGKRPPNPIELLLTPKMGKLVELSRKAYDYVILDCAPAGMVSDANAVAQYCDGILYVLSSGIISYKYAKKVQAGLNNTGCPILGVILNKVDTKTKKYYGHYGGYYERY